MDIALNNVSGGTPTVHYLKGYNASNCFAYGYSFLINLFAESQGSSMANYDSRSILQNYRFVFPFPLLSHRPKASEHHFPLASHFVGLFAEVAERKDADQYPGEREYGQDCVYPDRSFVVRILLWGFLDPYIGINVLICFVFEGGAVFLLYRRIGDWKGWLLAALSLLCFVRLGIGLEDGQRQRHCVYRQSLQHNSDIVPHKYLDTL